VRQISAKGKRGNEKTHCLLPSLHHHRYHEELLGDGVKFAKKYKDTVEQVTDSMECFIPIV
jgi:hypothetical protein